MNKRTNKIITDKRPVIRIKEIKMNKLKHTPGPWKIEEYEDEFLKIVTDYKSGFQDIIICQGIYKSGGICDNNNARLIAAAPEMLEALIVVYKTNEHWGRLNHHRWGKDLEKKIQTVIEKSTGQKIDDLV